MDMRLIAPGNRQPHRLGAGRKARGGHRGPFRRRRGPTLRALVSIETHRLSAGRYELRVELVRARGSHSSARCRRDNPSTGWAVDGARRRCQHDNATRKFLAAAAFRPRRIRGAGRDDDDLSGAVTGAVRPDVGSSRFCLTTMRSPSCSTCQTASGLSAGARWLRWRKSKQAWCQGQRMLSPTTSASASARDSGCKRFDGEHLPAGAHQQDILIADMPSSVSPVNSLSLLLRQIGAARLACCSAMFSLPWILLCHLGCCFAIVVP